MGVMLEIAKMEKNVLFSLTCSVKISVTSKIL